MNDDATRVESFRAIYTAHHGDLWRYCLRRTSTAAEAEDVLGDVFTIAWRRLDDIPPDEAARPWLFAVARNHLHNHRRRSSRNREMHLRLVSEAATAAERSPDHVGDRSTDVLDALSRLSEADAEILRLAVWEELPHSEIAAVVDCTENAVAIRIHRARRRLGEHLTTDVVATPTHTTEVRSEGDRHV